MSQNAFLVKTVREQSHTTIAGMNLTGIKVAGKWYPVAENTPFNFIRLLQEPGEVEVAAIGVFTNMRFHGEAVTRMLRGDVEPMRLCFASGQTLSGEFAVGMVSRIGNFRKDGNDNYVVILSSKSAILEDGA